METTRSSRLAAMIHTPLPLPVLSEHPPAADFAGAIEKTWFADRRPGAGPWTFDITPDGSFDILFILSGADCTILFTGPYTKLRRVFLPDSREYFCVRFRPGMMPAIADVTAQELVNSWVRLPKVLGASSDELGEKLLTAGGLAAKTRIIEAFFRKAGLDAALPQGLIRRCAAAVDAAHGSVRVDEIARHAGMSTRTLERLFREQVGISPKTFMRNIRFQHALARLRTRGRENLAAIACDCGYFDQSHFIKDFAALAGRLPSAL